MRVFWDTNLFIYLWESKGNTSEMGSLCERTNRAGYTVVTSTLTVGEILVHPYRLGREEVADQYRQAFAELDVIPFDSDSADLFGQLRAANPSLWPPDAIQLACAVKGGCEVFLTNDERLSRVEGVGGLIIAPLARWQEVL